MLDSLKKVEINKPTKTWKVFKRRENKYMFSKVNEKEISLKNI